MSCQICGVASGSGQFCVACGKLLGSTSSAVTTQEREGPSRNPWLAFQEIRLLACPRCGAPNSAARWQCARCGHAFNDASGDEPVAERPSPVVDGPTVQPESARWVALITVVVGVAAVAVAVALLASRGVGPFPQRNGVTSVAPVEQAGIARVRASAAAPEAQQRLVADGDASTAWRTNGVGVGEWIELQLQSTAQIDHLLVWNGDQRNADAFAGADRVGDVMIMFPDVDRSYTVTFPDRTGNFRVDMPDPPVSRRIRIRIDSVHGNNGQAALSEVEALVSAQQAGDG